MMRLIYLPMRESLNRPSASETDTERAGERHANVENRIRDLHRLVPHVPGYIEETMRVLQLNRARSRGHPGRTFVARDLKTLREIQRSRMQQTTSGDYDSIPS